MASLIDQATTAIGTNLQLYVSTGFLVPNANWSRVLFDVSGTDLSRRDYTPGDGTLKDVAACTNLSQFATAIRSIDGAATAWHWADVVIGLPFTLDPSGTDDLNRCAKMLKPFERWMRTS